MLRILGSFLRSKGGAQVATVQGDRNTVTQINIGTYLAGAAQENREINGADRVLLTALLRSALLTHKGQAFEDFFTRCGTILWGQDFEPWRPQGRLGDRKCDGYRASDKTVFQCYAPDHFVASAVASKIREDFVGAHANFGADIRKWVFVHNQDTGIPAEAGQLVVDLRAKHPSIEIEIWAPSNLSQQLLKLPSSDLGNLFPELVRDQRFSAATGDLLQGIIDEEIVEAPRNGAKEQPENRFALDETLDNLNDADRDVRQRLLGYARWYDPLQKGKVVGKLGELGHSQELVMNNAQRLHDAGLIKMTENYLIPLNEEVCQQAAESLMAEILLELKD